MSIINFKEDWSKLTVIRSPGKLAATRGFTIAFDNKDNPIQRPLLANEANGVPHYGDYHPFNQWLYVDNKTVTAQSPILFEVLVHYTSADIKPHQNGPVAPWDEPPIVRWGSCVSNEKIDKDVNGKAIVNSAKESPDPPITEDVYDSTLTITDNVKSFNDDHATYYKNKVNSNTFYGKPPGSVLCTEYASEDAWFGKTKYYKRTRQFVIRIPVLPGVKGWTKRILDEGFTVLAEPHISPTNPRILITVKRGNLEERISEPALLDGKGQLLAPSAAGSPQAGHYLEFETKKAVSFTGLK